MSFSYYRTSQILTYYLTSNTAAETEKLESIPFKWAILNWGRPEMMPPQLATFTTTILPCRTAMLVPAIGSSQPLTTNTFRKMNLSTDVATIQTNAADIQLHSPDSNQHLDLISFQRVFYRAQQLQAAIMEYVSGCTFTGSSYGGRSYAHAVVCPLAFDDTICQFESAVIGARTSLNPSEQLVQTIVSSVGPPVTYTVIPGHFPQSFEQAIQYLNANPDPLSRLGPISQFQHLLDTTTKMASVLYTLLLFDIEFDLTARAFGRMMGNRKAWSVLYSRYRQCLEPGTDTPIAQIQQCKLTSLEPLFPHEFEYSVPKLV